MRLMAKERKCLLKMQRIPANSSTPHNAIATTCKTNSRLLAHVLPRYLIMSAPIIISNGGRPSKIPRKIPLERECDSGWTCSEGICSSIDNIPFSKKLRDFERVS